MADCGALAATPDRFSRGLFVTSLVALFLSVLFWLAFFTRPFRVIFDQLGMTELPAVTNFALILGGASNWVLPTLGVVLLIIGIVGLKRANARTLNRFTAVNFILAVLLPWFGYLSLHLPLTELQRKLGGG